MVVVITSLLVVLFLGYVIYRQHKNLRLLNDELESAIAEKGAAKLENQILKKTSLKDHYVLNPRVKFLQVTIPVSSQGSTSISREEYKKLASKIGYTVLNKLTNKMTILQDGKMQWAVEFFLQENIK